MGTNTLYTEKHHQYIKYTKVSKPSMSYKFKTNINHNHSVSNPTHNNNKYPKHKTITITILFHSDVFPQYLNNITRNLLPSGS